MGRIDELVSEVNDPKLRRELTSAILEIKRHQNFGLVFEEHIPETNAIQGFNLKIGSIVQLRNENEGKHLYKIVEIDKEKKEAKISPIKKGNEQVVLINELLVVRRFGEPTYSVFTPVGSVKKNDDKPYNIAINGENYHALQLLNYLLEKQVDLIYIDPPYNTGVKDWKYNNCYVDSNDSWRRALACP